METEKEKNIRRCKGLNQQIIIAQESLADLLERLNEYDLSDQVDGFFQLSEDFKNRHYEVKHRLKTIKEI